jgi:hypothetical protein
MPHALNMTIPIKQDAATIQKLRDLERDFTAKHQEKLDKALRDSQLVHYARVVNIGDKFLQVITEYDGDHKGYTEFFRQALPELFAAIFELAEAPPFGALDENSFFNVSKKLQHRSLGTSTDGSVDGEGKPEGYLFSAYGGKSVKKILAEMKGEDDN